jgi:membrane protease YdiL (CAAX protease family)
MTDLDPRPRPGPSYAEIFFITGLLVAPNAIQALFAFLHPNEARFNAEYSDWQWGIHATQSFFLIAVLLTLVRRGGERIADFTKPFRPGDIAWGIGLTVLGYLAMLLSDALLQATVGRQLGSFQPQNVEAMKVRLSPLYVLAMLLNPVCEETYLRGYLQTRLKDKGWWAPNAVFLSVLAQASYHIYQGIPSCITLAAIFLTFAVFYNRTGRLWPVVIAHLNLDVLAMLAYAR